MVQETQYISHDSRHSTRREEMARRRLTLPQGVKKRISLSTTVNGLNMMYAAEHRHLPIISALCEIQFWTYQNNLSIKADDAAVVANVAMHYRHTNIQ